MHKLIPAYELNPAYAKSVEDKKFVSIKEAKQQVTKIIEQIKDLKGPVAHVTVHNSELREIIRKWLSLYGYKVEKCKVTDTLLVYLTLRKSDPDKLPL